MTRGWLRRSEPWAALAAVALGMAAIAAFGAEPDPRIASTDVSEICASDGRPGSAYSRTHRVVRRPGRAGYEHDHVLPLCLGGADTEANLQWQPLDEAHQKDRVESWACREVCHGRVPLATAQSWFIGDNWRAVHVEERR